MRKFIQKMTFGASYVGMLFLIPMMLLTSGEVVGRAVWSRPIPGSMELSSYMLAIFVLLGIAYTHQVGGQVRVTMLVSRIPEKAALVLSVLTTLLSLFIIGVMAWQGWIKAMEENTVSDMLRVPQFPFRMLVSVAGFFLFLELLLDLVDSTRKLIRS